MINNKDEVSTSNLWLLSAKLKGIAHLIQAQDVELLPPYPECWFGVGELIFEIAAELDLVRESFERDDCDRSSSLMKDDTHR